MNISMDVLFVNTFTQQSNTDSVQTLHVLNLRSTCRYEPRLHRTFEVPSRVLKSLKFNRLYENNRKYILAFPREDRATYSRAEEIIG